MTGFDRPVLEPCSGLGEGSREVSPHEFPGARPRCGGLLADPIVDDGSEHGRDYGIGKVVRENPFKRTKYQARMRPEAINEGRRIGRHSERLLNRGARSGKARKVGEGRQCREGICVNELKRRLCCVEIAGVRKNFRPLRGVVSIDDRPFGNENRLVGLQEAQPLVVVLRVIEPLVESACEPPSIVFDANRNAADIISLEQP